MNGAWLAIGTAVLSFFGAVLGSLITGYLAESYRQRNRFQLAAVDKRLEAYQKGCEWAVNIGAHIVATQDMDMDQLLSEEEKKTRQTELETMQREALRWVAAHTLYLGGKIRRKLAQMFQNPDAERLRTVLGVIEKEVGLPSLSENWWPFRIVATRDQQAATETKPKAT